MSFTPQALDYFASHAISPELAAEVGVREEAGALLYPYDGFVRTRPLNGKKTLQPKGVALTGWWPNGHPVWADAILVTEGEPDALAALTAGCEIPVVAMPGVAYARRLGDELRGRTKEALLAFDGDEAGDRKSVV